MSLRLRILLAVLVVYGTGGYFLTSWGLDQVRPRYLESIEESLVDTSVLLGSLLEAQVKDGRVDEEPLRQGFILMKQSRFDAQIFALKKTTMDLRVYVTDAKGWVLFDSEGKAQGKDFSQWNDVMRTLKGGYGARSTREVPGDANTQVLYVAAPVRLDGQIIGVVTVGKPTWAINDFVAAAQKRILIGALVGGVALLIVLMLIASWAISPLERLTDYARQVRDGRTAALPKLPGRTLNDLGRAFEEMRDSLEGRQHVERYTQTLAHEVKAPLAAIRGAAELMSEDMPVEQQRKFLGNIRNEAARIQQIVERLLELSSLEARKALRQTEAINVAALLSEAAAPIKAACEAGRIEFTVSGGDATDVNGERVLLREAVVNLLQNACDFTPAGGTISLRAVAAGDKVRIIVEDSGTGVPEYAMDKVFDRFYSLPRPVSGRKSTGLGLSLVKEIALLHSGAVSLEQRETGGTRAVLTLPLK